MVFLFIFPGNIVTEASLSHHCDDDMSVGLLQTDCADVAMVTLDSMQRANSTLQDFVKKKNITCFEFTLLTSTTVV